MFYIDKNSGIHISRGDSALLSTQPERVLEDGATEPIILDDNSCVIFTVKSKFSGETLIKRILTAADYVAVCSRSVFYPAKQTTRLMAMSTALCMCRTLKTLMRLTPTHRANLR